MAILTTALAVGLAACGATTASTKPDPVVGGSPLATAMTTAAGTWAIVPMGHLDERLNTFWQLFIRPSGTEHWSLVTPPGIADSGGIVGAASSGPALLAGILPSGNLKFSTLNLTSDGGKEYYLGALPAGLDDTPDALSFGANGKLLAILGNKEVVASSGALSSWSPILQLAAVERLPAIRACGITSLDAVTITHTSTDLVGAGCSRSGSPGIFAISGHSLRPSGPELPKSLRNARITDLRLDTIGPETSALLLTIRNGHETLVGATTTDSGAHWSVGSGLPVTTGEHLMSTGPATGGYFALLAGHGAKLNLYVDAASSWTTLPNPPAGTATVAFAQGQRPEAIVADNTSFSAWQLTTGGRSWRQVQAMQVPIQLGSSG